jgi:hypothetical protein
VSPWDGRGGDLLYRWGNPWVYGHGDTDAFLLSAVHDPKWVPEQRHFTMYDNNVADPGRHLRGGDVMVVEIEPPMAPDGSYLLGDDGVYGPAQPLRADDLGVSEAIWLNAEGEVAATAALYENSTRNPDDVQVFRLVSYPQDAAGVRAVLGEQ